MPRNPSGNGISGGLRDAKSQITSHVRAPHANLCGSQQTKQNNNSRMVNKTGEFCHTLSHFHLTAGKFSPMIILKKHYCGADSPRVLLPRSAAQNGPAKPRRVS